MKPDELVDTVVEELDISNIVVEAYPGWGKTKLAAMIADRAESVAVVTRTHEEMYELMRFSRGGLIPLFGKEKLCLMWRKGEDVSVYRYCNRLRTLGLCRYRYTASHELIRWLAGRKPRPEEVAKKAKSLGVCPYPSILTLASKARKVVTTYGFAYTYKNVLDKKLVIYDESHEILNILAGLVERIDDTYIETLVASLKKKVETRRLAYFIRACWRKSNSFREFVRLLERAPADVDNEFIDSIVSLFYSNKIYWEGKVGYILKKPVIKDSGQLFLTAYLPPFFMKAIPNLKMVRIPTDVSLNVIIDTDVTSRYEERSDETYRLYAEKIEDYYVANTGNLVVFPSYEFMEKVKQYLSDYILAKVKPPEAIRTIKEGDIVFDVAGGVGTEGVNPSPLLKRVIVVGLPYPPPTGELNLLSKLYGFDAVYTYMGLLKVVQAVGRLRFRENADAVLIDRRYKYVMDYFPPYISVS